MLKSFIKSKQGVAAIEFAIMLPFLLIVFYGVFQLSTYISAVRRIDNTTNDLAYIISREGFIVNKSADPKKPAEPKTGGKLRLENIIKI